MNERGAPTPVAWTRLQAPESLMGPADPDTMAATVAASPRHAKYAQTVDRESAREKLAAKLEEGARKAAEEQSTQPTPKAPRKKASAPKPKQDDAGDLVRDVVESGAFKDFVRTAAREIARGMFKSGRR